MRPEVECVRQQVNKVDVDVVLCSMRSRTVIQQAIKRLLELSPPPSRVILVVPRQINWLNETRDRVTVIYSEVANLAKQRNLGLEAAEAPILGFVDDDTVLDDHHLLEVVKAFDKDPDLVGVGGRIRNFGPAPSWLTLYRRVFMLSRPAPKGGVDPLPSGFFVWPNPAEAPTHVRAIWGCCMWWRTNKIRDLRFDERLRAFEDVEFGFRAGARGPLLLSGTALADHHRVASKRSDIKRSLRQIGEAWTIGRRFPDHGFKTLWWGWAACGQILFVLASTVITAARLLAPEYREAG